MESPPTPQEIIASASQGFIIRSCYLAGCVVYSYDYVLTFSQEVDRVWKRRLTLPTVGFLLLRYSAPLELAFSVGIFYPTFISALSCKVIQAIGALNILVVILIGCIMAFRTVALYNQNKFILWLLSAFILAQTVMLAVVASGVSVTYNVHSGVCVTKSPTELFITALWWCPLVVDTVIFVLTVIRLRALRKVMRLNYSLLHVIMRDGVFYYIVICLVYVSNTINWMVNSGGSKIAGLNCGLAIPSVLICRLTLNLQAVRSASDDTTTTTDGTNSGVLSSVPFQVPGRSVWLTGERWDGIYLEHSDEINVVNEREIPLTELQLGMTQ